MNKAWTYSLEISGVLMRNMSEQVSGLILDNLVPKYEKILTEVDNKEDYELITAVCFLNNCFECGDDLMFQVVSD